MSESITLVANIQYKAPPKPSSQVAEFGYDAEQKVLGVKFVSGGTYHYFDVPAEVAMAMDSAESVGGFLGKQVKGKFRYEKQPEGQAAAASTSAPNA